MIPTTPLKAMDENCDTITDKTLCIEGGKLMETTSQSFRLTVRNISRFPVCKRNFRDREPSRVLEQRLYLLGTRPLDVGGAGDCLFRAVSHPLYGHPDLHFDIRISGVEYTRENPERFIESNSLNSLSDYLISMSRMG